MQVDVHDAGPRFAELIKLTEQGETVVIARDGQPVVELVQAKPLKIGFPFGIAKNEPLVGPGDNWWTPMSDTEADDWLSGK